ncbi:MAG: hypothetical protein LIO65_08205 [Odoribacter sp.]|nr:hypothetical protein [Odoribacter sp.]
MKRFLLALGLILCITDIWAQDGNNTLYFLPNSPQRIRVNPAYQPEYKTTIGVPGLNGAFVNYYNNSLKVNDVLRWGQGEKADSIVVDADKLHKALRKKIL